MALGNEETQDVNLKKQCSHTMPEKGAGGGEEIFVALVSVASMGLVLDCCEACKVLGGGH